MTNDIPVSPGIDHQVHTTTPTVSDSTIMDDTVVTMDSASALMGGETVTMPAMKHTAKKTVPSAKIKISR